MKFSFKDFSSKYDQIHTFTEKIINGKLNFCVQSRSFLQEPPC